MPLHSESHPLGLPFIELQSVDSTNKYAMQLAHEGMAQHGMAVFAHEQTSGKGQRGKTWQSDRDKNIILSILISGEDHHSTDMFPISAWSALATMLFFRKYAGATTTIKWPNDIYWQDRKAGGILIENILSIGITKPGKWKWAVIGIGVNINQTSFSSDLPNPVSLKQITGKSFNPVQLAKEMISTLDSLYSKLLNNEFGKIHSAYNENLYKRNQQVKLKKGNRSFEATIKGVNRQGQLVIEHAVEEVIDFGKAAWLL